MKATVVAVGETPTPIEETQRWALTITLEVLLYAAIVGVAAVLRLWNLEAAPLSAREAAQALAAFNGTPLPAGGSPLLYGLNQVLFGLFSTTVNDAGVRLGAALIGTLMVALPVLFRSHIGRYGALAAALMLALSPTLVVASRSVDGSIGVATFTLAAIGLGLRYFTTQKQIDLIGLAIAIGVTLACGYGVITVALVIAPALIIIYRWVASDEDRLRVKQLRAESHMLRTALLWGGAAFILAATTFFLRPNGLAGVPEIISAWLAAWSAQISISVVQLVQILLAYDLRVVKRVGHRRSVDYFLTARTAGVGLDTGADPAGFVGRPLDGSRGHRIRAGRFMAGRRRVCVGGGGADRLHGDSGRQRGDGFSAGH
jgi:predicted membrane-bound mannosyltransferase